ncbi:MAG: SWIM zinc finger family protein [Victivallaceae bacterium]|nr:SWIM zinc finger family protein [Victivallaceae bacterium]
MSRYYDDYPAYVSVAERKHQIQQKMVKLRKQGQELSPVVIEGRLIARTFWGKAWCTNIESYHDYSNRLPRARSYVKHGAVVDLKIETGKITALVQGSELYNVDITIEKLNTNRWEKIKQECAGKINSLIDLIQGKLSDEVIALLCRHDEGLFPAPNEIRLDCDCPDWADLCKHLAAVLYGIGARLDHEPELFFLLRGVDQHELFTAGLTDNLTGTDVESDIADDALGDIFGIDLDELDDIMPEPSPVKEVAKPKKQTAKAKSTKATPRVKKVTKKSVVAKSTVVKKPSKSKSQPIEVKVTKVKEKKAGRSMRRGKK